jgi:esterase/lipase superfamily enzyme
MKNLITLVAIVVSLISFSSRASAKDNGTYEPRVGLYTKDEFRLLSTDQIPLIFDKFIAESPEKNIILYIHGRGRDTDSEWKTISYMEEKYAAKVVMFHWPSWSSLITRPVAVAKESAHELDEVIKLIRDYKEAHSDVFAHKKITLLAHSMGNVVVREFVENYYAHDLNNPELGPLFENFVSAGADIGFTDHRPWFEALDFTNKKFVLMNNRDIMLLLSYLLDLKIKEPFLYKLGLGVERFPMKKEKLVKYLDPGTTYIDLSKSLNVDHRYFESTKPLMTRIFKPLLNGENFEPSKVGAKVKREAGISYVID